MNTRKPLQIYNVIRYTFKVQTALKTKKYNSFEYFDQIILMKTKKLRLIKIQASVFIIFVKIFTQCKEITRVSIFL